MKWGSWLPLIAVVLMVLLGWYLVFGVGLVPAFSRDPLGVGVDVHYPTR